MGARSVSAGNSSVVYETLAALKDNSKNGVYITESEMAKIANAVKESGLSSGEAEKTINETIDTYQKSKGSQVKQHVTVKKSEFAGEVNKVEFNLSVLKKEKKSDIVMDNNVKGSYKLTQEEAFARGEKVVPLSEKKKNAVTRADHINVIYDEKIEKAKKTKSGTDLKIELSNIEKERSTALDSLNKKPVTTREEHLNVIYDDKIKKLQSQMPSPARDSAMEQVENDRKKAIEDLNKKPAVTREEHINIIYDDKIKKAHQKYDGSTPALSEALYNIEAERQAALKKK